MLFRKRSSEAPYSCLQNIGPEDVFLALLNNALIFLVLFKSLLVKGILDLVDQAVQDVEELKTGGFGVEELPLY